MPDQYATTTLTRTITVAGGLFAPGHLGELTRQLPFDLVDAVLAETRTLQQRLRQLPSRVGVYFVLALALFPSLGYARVWDKLVAGLRGLNPPRPSEKALRDVRRRLGPAPLKLLFDSVAGPVAQPHTPGVRYRYWRTVAFDGCSSIKAPDHPRVRGWLGKVRRHWGVNGYPELRLMALCETGTRALLGAALGPTSTGEIAYAQRLTSLLTPDMLLLADRGFDSDDFLCRIARTGAHLLVRVKSRRTPAALTLLPDGSYLTVIGGVKLRVIEAEVTATTSDGARLGDRYRLVTTLTDHCTDPATTLTALYHERWEVESAFYALRHTLLGGLVLRSRERFGLEQELWAQLTVYQALRRAMTEAVESAPGTDADRASFTVALETARDQLTQAEGVLPEEAEEGALAGGIGEAVLAALLPSRRARVSARRVKCAMSRYGNKPNITEKRPRASADIVRVQIGVLELRSGTVPLGNGLRGRVLQLLRGAPERAWSTREIAQALNIAHYRSLNAQLGRWVKEGMLRRVGRGEYALAGAWISPADPIPAVLTPQPTA